MANVLKKLHVETFVLNISECLEDVLDIDGFHIRRRDDNSFEVDISKDRALNDLFRALSERNIRVLSMRNKVNRLEELFMRLVTKE